VALRLYDKSSERANKPRFPATKMIAIANQLISSMTLDNTCKQTILESLDISIHATPEPEAVRRFSLIRFFGEIR
jgi:hypothetical protein